MSNVHLSEFLQLSVSERAKLAQVIWDSIAETPDSIPLTDKEREELNRRLSAYLKDTNTGKTWKEVKNKILDK